MKTTVFSIISLTILILLFSCKDQPKVSDEALIINENNNFKDTALVLENLISDIKIVPLETNEQCLISYFHGHVGEKYIIAFEREKILLFSGTGKFISIISQKGKGPNEFNYIDAWDVDEDEKFLHFHDVGGNYISRYNLAEAQFEKNIPIEDKGGMSGIVTVNDTLLAVLRGGYANYENLYFYVSTSGRITEGEKKKPLTHPGVWAGSSSVFKRSNDNSIFYQPFEGDTIFKINGRDKKTLLAMQLEDPVKTGNKTKGYHVGLMGQIGNEIFLSKSVYESEVSEKSAILRTTLDEKYLYDQDNHDIFKISSLLYDELGLEFGSSFNFQSAEQLLINYQATYFKDILEKNIEDSDIDEAQKSKLQQLNDKISEGDNPILITGKCKKS
ncbi:6-bladed beta-propeller [Marinilabilia rubra]|uniref:6-bladed beta-propeller n=1 Tax=Marinilabilia rubra TaxID=2162893 RepID=A0A2U2BAV0_9BACT|nr:6-bladed beta-propeller [Marinilabilia rubra]PWE00190.1 hypothetical protein DDZ16_07505 [Marinilabilia rubra]